MHVAVTAESTETPSCQALPIRAGLSVVQIFLGVGSRDVAACAVSHQVIHKRQTASDVHKGVGFETCALYASSMSNNSFGPDWQGWCLFPGM